ncbi:MAG: hypothetical protein HY078_16605 [Elusimicrobia bacterium]|nr:hypothetical protein [Elusimicrobiota bacterium]
MIERQARLLGVAIVAASLSFAGPIAWSTPDDHPHDGHHQGHGGHGAAHHNSHHDSPEERACLHAARQQHHENVRRINHEEEAALRALHHSPGWKDLTHEERRAQEQVIKDNFKALRKAERDAYHRAREACRRTPPPEGQ